MRQGLEPSRQLQGLMEADQNRGHMTHTTQWILHGYCDRWKSIGRSIVEANGNPRDDEIERGLFDKADGTL